MIAAIVKRDDIDLADIIRRSPFVQVPDAEKSLRLCMARSIEICYGIIHDEVACMWGLRPPTVLSNTAWLWLLTTDIVAEHKFLFIRYSQLYIEEAIKRFPIIIGDVHINNRPAQRWIKWLGAEFLPPDKDRLPFEIRAK